MPLSAGSRLGPYEIVAPLGAGGMGEVYRAKDTRLDRDVAVKVLPQHLSSDPEIRARFEREARTISSFNHPHICTLHDVGNEDGTDYLVMELVQGETLAQRLARGPLPPAEVLKLGAQIADGLDRAHRAGVVHRDLKPGNVMLTRSGAKLMDFGLARGTGLGPTSDLTSSPTVAGPLTVQGAFLGTLQYMAPEQLEGQPGDARSDLWALGCVLYEMATGRTAFEGKTQASLITAIMGSEPAPMSQLTVAPPELQRLVSACLTKDPAERIQSAHDVKLQLGWMAPTATPAGPGTPARKQGAAIAGVIAAALLAGAAAGYFVRGRSAPASAGIADVTYTPVTFEEGFVFAARFAPDGRTIVYSADWDRQPRDLFVTTLGNPEFRTLGYSGSDLLAVSPTGEIAILSGSSTISGSPYRRVGTLARASLTGGAARPEIEHVHFADLGADGALAVVRSDRGKQTLEYPVDQVLAEHPTYTRSSSGYASVNGPRVSPSGEYVAAFDGVLGNYTVKVFDRGGKLVAASSKFDDWWGLAWRGPTELWYASQTADAQSVVTALGLQGEQRVVYHAPGALTLHDVAQQGDMLVSLDPPAGGIEILGENVAPEDFTWREGGVLHDFSDTHAVLFSTVDSGGPKGSVYIRKPGDRLPVRIADGIGVALSPDGGKALVSTTGSPRKAAIVPTGAGRPQPLDLGDFESLHWAGWLPDGRLVVEVARAGAKTTIEVLSPDGRAAAAPLPEGATLRGSRLISPDGSRIVAASADLRLEICTLATTGCRPLAGSRDGDEMAGWAADGKAVFVYRRQDAAAQVDRLDVDSGARSAWRTVRPAQATANGVGWLVASPDGALAYSYGRTRSQLYVIHGLK